MNSNTEKTEKAPVITFNEVLNLLDTNIQRSGELLNYTSNVRSSIYYVSDPKAVTKDMVEEEEDSHVLQYSGDNLGSTLSSGLSTLRANLLDVDDRLTEIFKAYYPIIYSDCEEEEMKEKEMKEKVEPSIISVYDSYTSAGNLQDLSNEIKGRSSYISESLRSFRNCEKYSVVPTKMLEELEDKESAKVFKTFPEEYYSVLEEISEDLGQVLYSISEMKFMFE